VSGTAPALAAASRWKTKAGVVHTTVVGKLTFEVGTDGRLAWVATSPIALFDRIAADPVWVAEASELMPWTTVASVVLYGGPLRFALEGAGSEPAISVSVAARAPAGRSMSSPERTLRAPERPSRGEDGVLVIPDGLDGRYFLAAPVPQQRAMIRGDERFVLELPLGRAEGRLPGVVVAVTVQTGSKQRAVALTPDMVVVDGAARRISVVSRALVRGDAKLVSHTTLTMTEAAAMDRGDAPPAARMEDFATAMLEVDDATAELTSAELDKLRAIATPFSSPGEATTEASYRAPPAVPATPFDPGFAPAAVIPGQGVASTFSPTQDLDAALAAMRKSLRAEAPEPEPEPPPAPSSPTDGETTRQVAPPKPGAMATPRFKRR
jgi:hypothetical protein